MKKIALICGFSPVKDPRVLYELKSLKKHNFDVHLFEFNYSFATMEEYLDEFKINKILPDPLSRDKKFGLKVSLLPKINSSFSRIIKNLKYQKAFNFDFNLKDFDYIYTNDITAIQLIGHFYNPMKNQILLTDLKEVFFNERATSLIKSLKIKIALHYFLRNYKYGFAVSSNITDLYKKNFRLLKMKFYTLPNSIPFMNFETVKKINDNNYIIKIILTCNFIPKIRGIETLIEIFSLIKTDYKLYFRMTNITEKAFENLVPFELLNKKMFFLNPVPESEMVKTMLDYDIGIIPYDPNVCLNHLYCCPNKFGQYLNAGLGIISSNSKYISNLIEDGKLGITYDLKKVKKSAEKIEDFLLSYEKSIMAQRSFNYAKKSFNWEEHIKVLIDKLNYESSSAI